MPPLLALSLTATGALAQTIQFPGEGDGQGATNALPGLQAPAAQPQAPTAQGKTPNAQAPTRDKIRRSEELPDAITHAIELEGREGIAFMSQNGRFVLRGRIFDMWTGETIDTMADLRSARQTMSLDELGLKDEDVDPFYYGSGPREVTMFVDPLCPYCAAIFDALRADPSFAEAYTITFYVVPFLGDRSVKAVNALSCAEDRDRAIQAMLEKDRAWMKRHEADAEGCDVQPILNRTLLTQMIGVSGVPYIIGAEGGISRGMPQDLRTFLAAN